MRFGQIWVENFDDRLITVVTTGGRKVKDRSSARRQYDRQIAVAPAGEVKMDRSQQRHQEK